MATAAMRPRAIAVSQSGTSSAASGVDTGEKGAAATGAGTDAGGAAAIVVELGGTVVVVVDGRGVVEPAVVAVVGGPGRMATDEGGEPDPRAAARSIRP